MKIKLTKKLIAVIITLVLLVVMVPAVSAYEAHVIDVRAHVKELPPATRTPGYWRTHLDYTKHVFEDYLSENIDLGWRYIDNIPDLMGIFWSVPGHNSDIWKKTENWDRDPLCQARFKTSWQALAAVLNSALPNGAPLPVLLEDIQSTLCSTDNETIHDLGELLNEYNESFDDNPIDDCDFLDIMNDTCPKKCLEKQGLVDYQFADCTYPSDCP